MEVKIYKPAKSAMQSGRARNKWIIEISEDKNIRHQNNLMGWVSSDNTLSELKFEFNTKEEAIEFAKKSNFKYSVKETAQRIVKKKSYAENFVN